MSWSATFIMVLKWVVRVTLKYMSTPTHHFHIQLRSPVIVAGSIYKLWCVPVDTIFHQGRKIFLLTLPNSSCIFFHTSPHSPVTYNSTYTLVNRFHNPCCVLDCEFELHTFFHLPLPPPFPFFNCFFFYPCYTSKSWYITYQLLLLTVFPKPGCIHDRQFPCTLLST